MADAVAFPKLERGGFEALEQRRQPAGDAVIDAQFIDHGGLLLWSKWPLLTRHGRACHHKSGLPDLWRSNMRNSGKPELRCHPRLVFTRKTWMPGTRSGMTGESQTLFRITPAGSVPPPRRQTRQ